MNHKSKTLVSALICLATMNAWPQQPSAPASPVLRLRKAAIALRQNGVAAEKTLQRLDVKVPKNKQLGKILQSLKKTNVDLFSAQKALSKFDGRCAGLKIDDWKPIIAADQQIAQSVQNLKKIRTDLALLQKAQLGPGAALKTAQNSLNSSAAYLQQGLAAEGLAGAGRLLEAHNAYCKVQDKNKSQLNLSSAIQTPRPAAETIKRGNLTSHNNAEKGIEVFKDAKETVKKAKEAVKVARAVAKGKAGGLGDSASGTSLFWQIFGDDIKDLVLAELGDSDAYAHHVGKQLDERLAGTLGNAYAHGGQGDLLVNDAGQVYDKNKTFLGTLDENGHVVPAAQALRDYNPTFHWINSEK